MLNAEKRAKLKVKAPALTTTLEEESLDYAECVSIDE